jgi:hypothetical protein
MLDPIRGAGAHDDAVPLGARAFEKARQGAVERRLQQVIEADLGHVNDPARSVLCHPAPTLTIRQPPCLVPWMAGPSLAVTKMGRVLADGTIIGRYAVS